MIIFIAITILSLIGLVYAAFKIPTTTGGSHLVTGSRQVAEERRFLSLQELEEVKDYATLLGVSNETIEDVYALLSLGRKMQGLISNEKIKELASASRENYIPPVSTDLQLAAIQESHLVTSIVRTTSLINCKTIFVIMNRIEGGDRNGEEKANYREAA